MTPAETLQQIYRSYAARDLVGALALCSDDFRFCWPVDPGQARRCGVSNGKAGFAERLEGLAEDFVYRSFTPLDIVDGGDEAAAQVEIEMTHKATGRDFRMRVAQFWTFRDGQAVELVEYYDTALVQSLS